VKQQITVKMDSHFHGNDNRRQQHGNKDHPVRQACHPSVEGNYGSDKKTLPAKYAGKVFKFLQHSLIINMRLRAKINIQAFGAFRP
jgi:hypothetical protein